MYSRGPTRVESRITVSGISLKSRINRRITNHSQNQESLTESKNRWEESESMPESWNHSDSGIIIVIFRILFVYFQYTMVILSATSPSSRLKRSGTSLAKDTT